MRTYRHRRRLLCKNKKRVFFRANPVENNICEQYVVVVVDGLILKCTTV